MYRIKLYKGYYGSKNRFFVSQKKSEHYGRFTEFLDGVFDYISLSTTDLRFNNGTLILNIDEFKEIKNNNVIFQNPQLYNYVLIYDYDNANNIKRRFYIQNYYYFVKSIKTIGNAFHLQLELDYFSTYYDTFKAFNFNVSRSNMKLGTGLYDPIQLTNTSPVYEYLDYSMTTTEKSEAPNSLLRYDALSIVFSLNFNVVQNKFGNVATTRLFAINLYDLKKAYCDKTNDAKEKLNRSKVNPIDLAIAFVGGINKVSAVGIYGGNDCEVLKAYLIDTEKIALMREGLAGVISSNQYNLDSYGIVYLVRPLQTERLFHFNKKTNYKYYIGTKAKGLPLIKTTENYNNEKLLYIYRFGATDVQILVKYGEEEMDITDQFELAITTNQGEMTGIRAISNALKLGIGTTTSLVANTSIIKKAKGELLGTLSGASGIVSTINNTFDNINQKYNGNIKGNGIGIANFYYLLQDFSSDVDINLKRPVSYNPYVITSYKSLIDEEANARLNGVATNFKYFGEDFISQLVFGGYTPIQEKNDNDPVYIKCDCEISNIPYEAIEIIKNIFNNGIYLYATHGIL